MEDALVHGIKAHIKAYSRVLILVLMEDALVLFKLHKIIMRIKSLNPCFNGRCTRTCNKIRETTKE